MAIRGGCGHDAGRVPRRSTPTWEEFARELGHNLRRARAAKGLSQQRVANMAGLTGFTYQKYEKGESRPGHPANPQLRSLVALSQVLDVPLVELLPSTFPDATGGR